MSKNYETNEVLNSFKKIGIKIKYNKNRKPIYLQAKRKSPIGIKTWGKIDFLKMNLVREG